MLVHHETGNGIPIIFIHGWGMHHGVWKPLIAALQESYHCYSFDLPGYGDNAAIESGQRVEEIADQLAEIFSFPAVVIGWSLGGLIATAYAARYPERVIKLITIASTPKFTKDETWSGLDPAVLMRFREKLLNDYQGTLEQFFYLQLQGVENQKKLWLTLKKERPVVEPSIAVLDQGLSLLKDSDLREALSELKQPVMHILGKLDAIVPASLFHCFDILFPTHRAIVIEKASHMPFISHRDELIKLIKEFV